MRRAATMPLDSSSPAVPLDMFCRMVRVRRLSAASTIFVSRLTCLGDGAVDDTDRLFRSLVHTIEHACLDDVNELLPSGARLSQREQLSDVLLTLPALLPRLLQRDGLAQFCPALLKAGDCAHLALIDCPPRTKKTMARFFQSTLRDILCYDIPSDEVLAELIWSSIVKETYFGL
ncbi:hypothetical protein FJT64_005919 [Amphibalanus amphitrite]|uniref:Uncharacterized protein n=1 Tax=Amphibalanus amphitrite TaxID=1232801 RepID=A0A6A4VZ95_AMPAM|nr:hypothetical protein FJT64_005919 [Amphibalanus amphitrite]